MADNSNQIFVWEVIGSIPTPNSGKNYPSYDNLRFAVVAKSMEIVMFISRKKYPDMRFHSIQKRNYLGKDSVLIDPELMEVKND